MGSNPSPQKSDHFYKNQHCYNPNGPMSTSLTDASIGPWILPRANQVSTGHLITPVCALVPPFRIHSHPLPKKENPLHKQRASFCWQRMRDSNPRERSQSPVCYRYTNPLSATGLLYARIRKSQAYIAIFLKNL